MVDYMGKTCEKCGKGKYVTHYHNCMDDGIECDICGHYVPCRYGIESWYISKIKGIEQDISWEKRRITRAKIESDKKIDGLSRDLDYYKRKLEGERNELAKAG